MLGDGSIYDLKFTLEKIERDIISFRFDGEVGKTRFKNQGIILSLRENYMTSLTSLISVHKNLPELWIGVLNRPTENTVILVSGPKEGTSPRS